MTWVLGVFFGNNVDVGELGSWDENHIFLIYLGSCTFFMCPQEWLTPPYHWNIIGIPVILPDTKHFAKSAILVGGPLVFRQTKPWWKHFSRWPAPAPRSSKDLQRLLDLRFSLLKKWDYIGHQSSMFPGWKTIVWYQISFGLASNFRDLINWYKLSYIIHISANCIFALHPYYFPWTVLLVFGGINIHPFNCDSSWQELDPLISTTSGGRKCGTTCEGRLQRRERYSRRVGVVVAVSQVVYSWYSWNLNGYSGGYGYSVWLSSQSWQQNDHCEISWAQMTSEALLAIGRWSKHETVGIEFDVQTIATQEITPMLEQFWRESLV